MHKAYYVEFYIIAKKYDLDPIDIQDIVGDMESDGIRVTREDIEDMYLNGDLF